MEVEFSGSWYTDRTVDTGNDLYSLQTRFRKSAVQSVNQEPSSVTARKFDFHSFRDRQNCSTILPGSDERVI